MELLPPARAACRPEHISGLVGQIALIARSAAENLLVASPLAAEALRRYSVRCTPQRLQVQSFMNTELRRLGFEWTVSESETVLLMEKFQCRPCSPSPSQHSSYPGDVEDYLRRAQERDSLRQRGAAKVTAEMLHTKRVDCAHCGAQLPEPKFKGKVAVVYGSRFTSTARMCSSTCGACSSEHGYRWSRRCCAAPPPSSPLAPHTPLWLLLRRCSAAFLLHTRTLRTYLFLQQKRINNNATTYSGYSRTSPSICHKIEASIC